MSARLPRVIHDLLRRTADSVPERVAFVDETESLTYGEVYRQAVALAAHLRASGVERGDRVLFFMENAACCAVALFAVLLSGAAYSFVSPQTKEEKLRYLLADATPRAVFADGALVARFAGVFAGVPSVRTVVCRGAAAPPFESWDAVTRLESPGPDPFVMPLDLAALIYTSGSTGRPKGVMMTHQSMLYSIQALVEVLRLENGTKTLTVLPFSFNYGMYQMLLNVACAGTLYVEQGFTFPAKVLERMEALGIEAFPGVPTIFARLTAIHARTGVVLPSVTRITNTAAALAEDLIRQMDGLFPNGLVFRMYGLTECKRALYLEPELGAERPGSVGKAMPGAEVFLRLPNGDEVAPGEVGLLHVRSPGVMLGYWNQPEESARVLKAGRFPGERIFVTGDWFKADADGFFYFIGRSDDIIKTRGEKVSPAEVEGVLYALDGVREAAVVGVQDDVLGEAVRAYLALEPDRSLSAQDVKRHCAARLEPFMVPRDVMFLAELPKTDTGKIDKRRIRELSLEAPRQATNTAS